MSSIGVTALTATSAANNAMRLTSIRLHGGGIRLLIILCIVIMFCFLLKYRFLYVMDDVQSVPTTSAVSVPDHTMDGINEPHGGKLIDLVVYDKALEKLTMEASSLDSLVMNSRQLCDVEMLLNGGFSPLNGFMSEATYVNVLSSMRLTKEHGEYLWPMPITLDVSNVTAAKFNVGTELTLRDQYYNMIAVLSISDIWKPNKTTEGISIFGTVDRTHPGVRYLFDEAGDTYIGGVLRGIMLPTHYDFEEIRLTPSQLRQQFELAGWRRILAFQTRNPMHRAHIELTRLAAEEANAHLLIHPVVGLTQPGDIPPTVRVLCYKALISSQLYWPPNNVKLSLLPLAMRMGGPREALWHAIIRKNYGASHFVIGRDHAGTKSLDTGKDFFKPYDAQHLVVKYADELGIQIITSKKVVYVPETKRYFAEDTIKGLGLESTSISGTAFRKMLANGKPIPSWFSDESVVRILQHHYPPLKSRGVTLFFTGLSGSGKTTIAQALNDRLATFGDRSVSLLDGDVVRTYLSKDLGFSKKDRDTNVMRIAFVASQITKMRGISICSQIAPYEQAREEARRLINVHGDFIEIYVSTPVEECEHRDIKGLYKMARKGDINLSGVNDPYEMPKNPEIKINTVNMSVTDCVNVIINYLIEKTYISYDKK